MSSEKKLGEMLQEAQPMPKGIVKNQKGAIFAEYSLLATLIAIACIIALTALGVNVLGLFDGISF